MSTASETRKVRNFVFKRSKGKCECIHSKGVNIGNVGQCPEHIARETRRFVNKDNIHGEMVVKIMR